MTMRRDDYALEQLQLGEDVDAARLRRAWRNVIQALLPRIPPSSRRYLEAITLAGIEGDQVRLQLDSAFGRNWVQQRYQRDLQELLSQQLGFPITIVLVGEDAQSEAAPAPVVVAPPSSTPSQPAFPRPAFNPNLTFETFVVGASNQMAHAAAYAVSQGAVNKYNPLFIYSAPGLGKTHLLHAIGQTYLQRVPNAHVLYVSG
ncbi:MAG: DnaA/Hda family protein, partial [Fimbriimonadales bacterium]|nr:DnaA/Hda family protein [Fimbriimonadales bacterium]